MWFGRMGRGWQEEEEEEEKEERCGGTRKNWRMWPADIELGLLADGGLADVAGLVDGRQLEETGGCGRRTLEPMMGGGPAGVAGYHHHTSSLGRTWPSVGG